MVRFFKVWALVLINFSLVASTGAWAARGKSDRHIEELREKELNAVYDKVVNNTHDAVEKYFEPYFEHLDFEIKLAASAGDIKRFDALKLVHSNLRSIIAQQDLAVKVMLAKNFRFGGNISFLIDGSNNGALPELWGDSLAKALQDQAEIFTRAVVQERENLTSNLATDAKLAGVRMPSTAAIEAFQKALILAFKAIDPTADEARAAGKLELYQKIKIEQNIAVYGIAFPVVIASWIAGWYATAALFQNFRHHDPALLTHIFTTIIFNAIITGPLRSFVFNKTMEATVLSNRSLAKSKTKRALKALEENFFTPLRQTFGADAVPALANTEQLSAWVADFFRAEQKNVGTRVADLCEGALTNQLKYKINANESDAGNENEISTIDSGHKLKL